MGSHGNASPTRPREAGATRGEVEGYPQDLPEGKRISSKFLYNVTRSAYEQSGFSYARSKARTTA
jgi:hypothetical protein